MADTSTPGFGADAAGACARTAAGNRRNERVIPIFMVIPTEDSDFSASARSARTSKRRCEPQAGARTRNPSVRQDRSDRRGAETPRKANVEMLRALCRLGARIGEWVWPKKPRGAFLAIFSPPGGSPTEEAESAEKSGKLGVSATRRWIQCGATGGSRTEKRPPKRRVLR